VLDPSLASYTHNPPIDFNDILLTLK
jgi:hypothetical protein